MSLAGAPLTVLFAIIFLGEEVRWRRGLGMALALGGVGLAIGAPSEAGDPVGLGFAFTGVLIGAFASVFVKRLEVGAVALQAWAGLASLMVMLPATMMLESGQFQAVAAAPLAVAACVLYAGVVVSVGAHSAYFRLFQRYDANLIVPLTLLTPLLTIAFGTWLTGDEIGWPLIVGGAWRWSGSPSSSGVRAAPLPNPSSPCPNPDGGDVSRETGRPSLSWGGLHRVWKGSGMSLDQPRPPACAPLPVLPRSSPRRLRP